MIFALFYIFTALVRKHVRESGELLHPNFKEVEGEFVFAKSLTSFNTEDILVFLDELIKGKKVGFFSFFFSVCVY